MLTLCPAVGWAYVAHRIVRRWATYASPLYTSRDNGSGGVAKLVELTGLRQHGGSAKGGLRKCV